MISSCSNTIRYFSVDNKNPRAFGDLNAYTVKEEDLVQDLEQVGEFFGVTQEAFGFKILVF